MNTPDHIAGFVTRGKKWNPTTKQEEPANFLMIYLQETDPKTGDLKVVGTYKADNGQEYPQYKIIDGLHCALSSLTELVRGNKTKILLYRNERPKTADQKIRELEAKLAKYEEAKP